MLGAIIGDIVGSRFERNNCKGKEFDFFDEQCQPTDDSIMTLAVAKAIMETEKQIKPAVSGFGFDIKYDALLSQLTIKYMQELGRLYPDSGYGNKFKAWIHSEKPRPYESIGNGAAMRISPAGLAARTEAEAISLSRVITEVSHNSEEGLMGAEAVAVAIFMANQGYLKNDIRNRIALNYYPLDFTIDEIRPDYQFSATCQGTVPQAIECFLESNSYEDAVRLAISLGGDSDTIAAIAGSIAGAYYGIPEDIRAFALSYLDDDLRLIAAKWDEFIGETTEEFKFLTKYIGKLADVDRFDQVADQAETDWLFDDGEEDEDPEDDEELPTAANGGLVSSFIEEVYQFSEAHPEYEMNNYETIIKKCDQETTERPIDSSQPSQCGANYILALISQAIQTGSDNEETVLEYFRNGTMLNWLKQLKDIDWQSSSRKLREIYLEIGKIEDTVAYSIVVEDEEASLYKYKILDGPSTASLYLKMAADSLFSDWHEIKTHYWEMDYPNKIWPLVYDADQWLLFVRYEGLRGEKYEGDNNYPENWDKLLSLFRIEN